MSPGGLQVRPGKLLARHPRRVKPLGRIGMLPGSGLAAGPSRHYHNHPFALESL